MKKTFVCLGFAAGMLLAGAALAGGDGPMVEAPVYKEDLIQISIPEAEVLKSKGWKFYDVNTLEIWADGFIPGATFFNVQDWKKLLPVDKNTPMVFLLRQPPVRKQRERSPSGDQTRLHAGPPDARRHLRVETFGPRHGTSVRHA